MVTYWVAYSHMIPISLYVIIELLKLGQSYLIGADVQMYDPETDAYAKCRNSDLVEEMGQVEMIFSDKTGTLTMNRMVFKKCQINTIRIGDLTANDLDNPEGLSLRSVSDFRFLIEEEFKEPETNCGAVNFLHMMALCHTVVCDVNAETGEIRY